MTDNLHTRLSNNNRTTVQLLSTAASSIYNNALTFILLSLVILSFRTVVENGTHHLTSFIDNDPSLKSLLSRIDLPPQNQNPNGLRRHRRPFLHLTRVGTLDDDFFSGDETDPDRTLFGVRHKTPVNGSLLVLYPRFGFSGQVFDSGVRVNEVVNKPGFRIKVDEEGLRGLLGDGFKGRGRWRGSTRLLLLDERYADRGIEELPEAVKAVLKEDTRESEKCICELVRCKLTLFYDYWQMYEILEAILPTGMVVPSAFETVGHIAHLNLRDEHLPYKKVIAKVVLDKNKPKIRTVVNKIDAIHNDYRTMELEVLAGNHSLVTTVVESGLRFNVDLAAVYWNSRLATERQRLVNGFTRNDVICDVFSGVGPISICAAKVVKRVYANDLNPYAVEYLERNSVLNKLERKIQVFNMDGRRFINAMFTSEKAESITQVIMNLPNDAVEFLDAFRGVFRDSSRDKKTKLPKIHVYGFSRAEDPEFDFHKRIRIALSEVAVDVEMRRVRAVAPGKWMLYASFILPRSVAYGEPVLD